MHVGLAIGTVVQVVLRAPYTLFFSIDSCTILYYYNGTVPPSPLVPPSTPQMLNLSNISPFSVDVTWSTPSDVGNPPGPLTYTVTLTNITDGTVLQYTLPSTQITLSNLLPGVQYNVSVYAKNSVASGPPVTGVFRTNNSGEFE